MGQEADRVEPCQPRPRADLDAHYTSYQDSTIFAVREGHSFDPANVTLGYETAFKENYPRFQFLREKYNKPEVAFQIGIPAPIDMAVDVFGFAEAHRTTASPKPTRQETAREITNIRKIAGDDVIFQIEKADTAKEIASTLAALAPATPDGTRFVAHLCLGNFHHKALATMNGKSSRICWRTL